MSGKLGNAVDVLIVEKGGHLTTRAHNRHLIYYPILGTWYAFIGTSKALHARGVNALFTSQNGVVWKLEHTFCKGYGTSSSQDTILVGNKMYLLHWPNDWQAWDARYGGTPADVPIEYRVRKYNLPSKIGDTSTFIDYTAIHGRCESSNHFYGSICRDTNGYFWVGSRCYTKGMKGITRAFATRSYRPNDISVWEQPALTGRRKGNSVCPEMIPLENGQVIAVNHYSPFSEDQGKAIIAAALYNSNTEKWAPETEVAMGNVSKRLRGTAEFDPTSKRIHLVYPDEQGDIRHKILSAPYGPDNWSPKAGEKIPGKLVVSGSDDDLSIALDYSKKPATITLVYGKEGIVYRKDYKGEKWLKNDTPILKGSNMELSLNRDASEKIGLLFRDTESERGNVIKFLELSKKI